MSLPEFDVTGQKVLIVGAGRGIGKGIALAFAEAGADVAIASLTASTVGKVADEIRAMDRTALPVTGDATKAADMDNIASQVLAEFGAVDLMEQREHLLSLGIADAVKYRLRLLASGDESFFAQLGEVLREGGLAQADSLGQLASPSRRSNCEPLRSNSVPSLKILPKTPWTVTISRPIASSPPSFSCR